MSKKTFRQMERNFKGLANHYRLAILLLLLKYNELTLEQIVELLKANTKTISEHTHRLVRAGLVKKYYLSNYVAHRLTPYGKEFALIVKNFQNK